MTKFIKLEEKWKEGKYLCVGLDTDPEKTGGLSVFDFNKTIIDSTKDLVCAYKLNAAFYEKYGPAVMKETVDYIKATAPDVFLIVDAKRGDIGNTNEGYTYFVEDIGFDSMTIHSYMGKEANDSFLKHEDKLFFILAKTSNPGSGEFQDLETEGLPLYLRVTKNVREKWNGNGNCGLVVGATYPEHMLRARDIAGDDIIFLVPGMGAQGGDLKSVIECGLNKDGGGVVINMSRSVIYSSDPRAEAERFNEEVKEYLKLLRRTWAEEKREVYNKRMLEIFEKTRAVITNSHFIYASGTHGSAYMTKDRIMPDPILMNEVGMMLADLIKEKDIDTVAVPAVGGIVLGHAVARYLSYFKGKTVNSVFVEKKGKDEQGRDLYRVTRGYEKFLSGRKVAMIEDTVNTGYSIKSVIDCVKEAGGRIEVVGIICNRGIKAEELDPKAELESLTSLDFETYQAEDCPLCKDGIPFNAEFGHGKK